MAVLILWSSAVALRIVLLSLVGNGAAFCSLMYCEQDASGQSIKEFVVNRWQAEVSSLHMFFHTIWLTFSFPPLPTRVSYVLVKNSWHISNRALSTLLLRSKFSTPELLLLLLLLRVLFSLRKSKVVLISTMGMIGCVRLEGTIEGRVLDELMTEGSTTELFGVGKSLLSSAVVVVVLLGGVGVEQSIKGGGEGACIFKGGWVRKFSISFRIFFLCPNEVIYKSSLSSCMVRVPSTSPVISLSYRIAKKD